MTGSITPGHLAGMKFYMHESDEHECDSTWILYSSTSLFSLAVL